MPVAPSKNPEMTRHQYVADILWTDAAGNPKRTPWSGLHYGSIDAIHAVHRFAQREKETNADRKVVRPCLDPHEYQLKNLRLIYVDVTKQQFEEVVPIPLGPNPDLRKAPKVKKEPPPEFGFIEEVINQTQTSQSAGAHAPSIDHA